MDIKRTGALIAELRKRKNSTQKELADQLGVTDKAVSKWERGVGYPEVTTIPVLAELLGVSASEIILGQLTNPNPDCNNLSDKRTTDVIVSDTAGYIEQLHAQKKTHSKNIAFIVLTAIFIIGIFVSCLCNFVIDRQLSWSLYVVGSEITAWLIIVPFLKLNRNRFVTSMAGLTISIVPLLALIEYLCPIKGWVIAFALPIVGISLISLWIFVLLFIYVKIRWIYMTAFGLILFGVIDNITIHQFVNRYLHLTATFLQNLPTVIISISCGFISLILILFAVIKKQKIRTMRAQK